MIKYDTYMTELILIFRICLATIFSLLIGIQRGKAKNNSSILRTHVLVGVGAVLIAALGEFLLLTGVTIDITRMTAQIISGIGFLGIGVIMKTNNNHVSGLTTATSIWVTACISITVGFGAYLLAGVSTLIILIILNVIKEKDIN